MYLCCTDKFRGFSAHDGELGLRIFDPIQVEEREAGQEAIVGVAESSNGARG